ncbi:MAG: ABC transporter substrate-binding protein, partial [Chloroflexi bacterium]|nr:ABC transporter substrate-binding protein [Chloroflexota bacterium]
MWRGLGGTGRIVAGLLLAVVLGCTATSGSAPNRATARPGQTSATAAAPTSPRATPAAPTAAPAPVSIAYSTPATGFTSWPTMVARSKGFFERWGVQFEVSITPRIPDIVRGLAAGSLQVGAFIPDSALLAAAQGAPLALLGVETGRPVYHLTVQPSIVRFEDLRGKTFAVGAVNDATAGMLRRVLRLNGLGPGDYDLVSAGSTPERYAALASGQVAGVLLIPPLDFRAQREGFRWLADLTEVLPPFPANGLVANRDWARANRDAAVRWLAAMLESVRWLYDPTNRDEAVAILADLGRVSPEEA